MKQQNKSSSMLTPSMSWGVYALIAGAGYLLWRNRFTIQEFLEEKGISTPWLNNTLGDAVQSGAAKLSGGVKHEVGGTATH